MIKYMVISFMGMVVLVGFWIILFNATIGKKISEVEDRVGRTYLVLKDTVTVVDYSLVRQTYIGDNGKEYHSTLVEKLQPIAQ